MKKLLIILGILVLLVIGVLFVPPIYNRFTKPFFKNTVDAKEWYHQVDVMIGKGGMKFKNCVRLRGLDKSNYLAEARGILIHSAGKVTRFSGEKKYIPLGTESRGCFTVSRSCVEKVMQIYKESSRRRPVLIYAKYK